MNNIEEVNENIENLLKKRKEYYESWIKFEGTGTHTEKYFKNKIIQIENEIENEMKKENKSLKE